MKNYRAFTIDVAGHVCLSEVIAAADDDGAVAAARRLIRGNNIEIWLLSRKVATLNAIKANEASAPFTAR